MTTPQPQHLRRLINWFEIPVTDLTRAIPFYEQLLHTKLRQETCGPMQLAVFTYDDPNTGGCLCLGQNMQPSRAGVLIYLNCQDGLDNTLHRLANLNGKVIVAKTALPPGMGYFAVMEDCEGNAVGLHSLE